MSYRRLFISWLFWFGTLLAAIFGIPFCAILVGWMINIVGPWIHVHLGDDASRFLGLVLAVGLLSFAMAVWYMPPGKDNSDDN